MPHLSQLNVLGVKFLPAAGVSLALLAAVESAVFWLVPRYDHCLVDPPGPVWYLLLIPLVTTGLIGALNWRSPAGKALVLVTLLMLIPVPVIIFAKEFNLC